MCPKARGGGPRPGRTTRDEERLRLVELDTANRAVVLIESVDERSHAVIPQLDDARMKAGENPRAFRMEGEALDAVRLRLELRKRIKSPQSTPSHGKQLVGISFVVEAGQGRS